jgi:predicted dehydrogenase
MSRRRFVGGVATAAAFTIVPRHVLGQGETPPSDTLNIAGIGVGGMGANNMKKCADAGENIVALCDVDDAYAAATYQKYPKAKTYRDYREMLEKEKGIDAVVIATPDHSHTVIALAAMQLGKHVYVQKPMTRTVAEARKLTEAARQYKVVTQMGNQGHSNEGLRLLCEWIWDGAIGPVREVHCWTNRPVWPQGIYTRPQDTPPVPSTLDWNLWLGPAPERPYNQAYLPFNWRAWLDFGAGALGDMGCHVMDASFTALKLGYPISVEACTSDIVVEMWKKQPNNETYPMASIVHYTFPARGDMPSVKLHWYDGGMRPERPADLEPGREIRWDSGTFFMGDKGTIMTSTYTDTVRIIPESKMREYKQPAKTLRRVPGGSQGHERNWIEACKGNGEAVSNFDYSGPFTETVVMGNLAIRFPGRKIEWDGPNMKVTNLPEANDLVTPKYREGWKL